MPPTETQLPVPFVSVIIPVFDHVDRLDRCLEALESQTYAADRYEVIVVENGAGRLRPERITCHEHTRLARETRPGSYAARNAGMRIARGEVLAFTDADCLPAEDWIERGTGALLGGGGRAMVGGRVRCTFRGDAPSVIELYDSLISFRQSTFLGKWGFAATANLFTTRATVEAVGPFDPELKSGGDLEWGQRVRSRGLAQHYAEEVRVDHPARHSYEDVVAKAGRVAGGLADLARKRDAALRKLVADLPRDLFPLRVIAASFRDPRLAGAADRARFVALCLRVGWARAVERLRVHRGGTSRRS